MKRRQFIKSLIAAPLVGTAHAFAAGPFFDPSPKDGWRFFEVTTSVLLRKSESTARVWLPLPSFEEKEWVKPVGNHWHGNASSMKIERVGPFGVLMLAASWDSGADSPFVTLTSRIATMDRSVDFSKPGKVMPLTDASLFTRPTKMVPTDGIVKSAALKATRGEKTDIGKARAIYEWIVENTVRNPKVRGCGTGNIKGMLESGDLSGKCADLNALYVGLARASGLPARDVYGIRVADSRFGYRSLGKSGDITKAQHCRAEVWLSGFGWVPVDPADVRKVVLEEEPGLKLSDGIVEAARKTLFGSWEMNWMPYNFGADIDLPGSENGAIPFFMYPQGEDASGRFDSLDPETFSYRITSRETGNMVGGIGFEPTTLAV